MIIIMIAYQRIWYQLLLMLVNGLLGISDRSLDFPYRTMLLQFVEPQLLL